MSKKSKYKMLALFHAGSDTANNAEAQELVRHLREKGIDARVQMSAADYAYTVYVETARYGEAAELRSKFEGK